jgi:hypothetical protein
MIFSGFLRNTKNKITSYRNQARAVFTHTVGVGVVFCYQYALYRKRNYFMGTSVFGEWDGLYASQPGQPTISCSELCTMFKPKES